jgi:hypothetical protein
MDVLIGYEWSVTHNSYFERKYEFEDDMGNRFLVLFKNDREGPENQPILGMGYEITYFVWDDVFQEWRIDKMVKTNIYCLMSTIFTSIIPSFVSEKKFAKTFRFEGICKMGEDSRFRNSRTNIYIRYLNRNPIDGFNIRTDINKVFLEKKVR